jgi:hypothetical protein
MIASFHIAEVGPRAGLRLLSRPPKPRAVPGLRFAATLSTGPLNAAIPPRPSISRIALVAFWEREDALDEFLAGHPVAAALAGGWHARLEPVRHVGAFHELADLPRGEPMSADEPVAILTLGRARFDRLVPFMRANARAAGVAAANPALLASTGFLRPPRLVGTFSVWRTTAAMRAYATGRPDPAHRDAIVADREKPFTHEKMFIRFRPYAAVGRWDAVEPLTTAVTPQLSAEPRGVEPQRA